MPEKTRTKDNNTQIPRLFIIVIPEKRTQDHKTPSCIAT